MHACRAQSLQNSRRAQSLQNSCNGRTNDYYLLDLGRLGLETKVKDIRVAKGWFWLVCMCGGEALVGWRWMECRVSFLVTCWSVHVIQNRSVTILTQSSPNSPPPLCNIIYAHTALYLHYKNTSTIYSQQTNCWNYIIISDKKISVKFIMLFYSKKVFLVPPPTPHPPLTHSPLRDGTYCVFHILLLYM